MHLVDAPHWSGVREQVVSPDLRLRGNTSCQMEGATTSPWWWSSLDVRCGSRSLVVLFLRSKPGKMEFFVPAGTDLGVKLLTPPPPLLPLLYVSIS